MSAETHETLAMRVTRAGLLAAALAACGLTGGCAALTNPVADGVSVRRLPPELLQPTKALSEEELDQKREALDVAREKVNQTLESVYQARVALGLPGPVPQNGNLTDVPADLDQTFSSVRQALGERHQHFPRTVEIPA